MSDPWGKFYWADWLADPKLKLCSLQAQGLWMRMLCIAAEAKPVGYVVLEGNTLGAEELAAESGKPLELVEGALAELRKWGVFSVDRHGRIYSRRMIKDVRKAKTARKNGKSGGNPTLGKNTRNPASVNPQDKPQKPEARSQSNPPNPPPGGDEPEGFAKGWGAYPLGGRGNHGPDRASAEWPAAVARAGGVDRLQSAILAHAAQLQRSGGKAKTFDRWLRDGGFVAYLGAETAPSAALTWHGPRRVLEIVADGLGSEAKALSYLARCTWQDMPRRAVIAPDIWVRDKLIEAGLDRAGFDILIKEGRAA